MENRIREFFSELNDEPYANLREQRAAWFSFVDLLVATAMDLSDEHPEEGLSRVGVLFKDYELADVVLPSSVRPFGDADRFFELYQTLARKGFSPDGVPMFALSRISEGLLPVEFLALILALASSCNRKYERLFGILQEEKGDIVRATAGLALDLSRLFLSEEERDPSILLSEDSFLNRYILMGPRVRYDSELSRPLVIRPLVLDIILGNRQSLGSLAGCAAFALPPRMPDSGERSRSFVHEKEKEQLILVMEQAVRHIGRRPDFKLVIELSGETGIGKRRLLEQAAAESGMRVLMVDCNRLFLLEEESREEAVKDLVALCALTDTLPLLTNIVREDLTAFSALAARLQKELWILFTAVEKPLPQRVTSSFAGDIFRLAVPAVSAKDQELLWRQAAAERSLVFDPSVSMDELVSKYSMNPGRIAEVMDNVRIAGTSSVVEKELLEEQIRISCAVEFGENATRLHSPFTWEDLMIDEKSGRLLNYAADRIRFRAVVNEEFGFGEKLPYGRGTSIVFYGPPGTGKTMAAQVLANELGLAIYRIDLSQISSKYIGETEKNLGAVFEAAKNSNAILFFDEADSLFAKRTDVSSSHDKYANAQTSYLLQKIEEYSGVSILATNNLQNFDAAFKRRMTYLIPIEAPDEETRFNLWSSVFPEGAPLSEEVDLRLVAREIQLSGSAIKSAALAAAYRAAAGGEEITYDLLADAIDLECQKTGTLGMGAKLLTAVMSGA